MAPTLQPLWQAQAMHAMPQAFPKVTVQVSLLPATSVELVDIWKRVVSFSLRPTSRFASNKTNKYKQLSPLESGGTERLLTMIWAVNNFHSSGSPPVCCRRKWPPQKNKNDKRWFQNLSGELELPLSLTAHQSCLSFHGILISKVAGFRSSPLLGLKSLTLEICEYEMLNISKSGADVERNLSVRSSWWHCDLPWVPTHRWCSAVPRWHETWVAMSLQLPHPFQSPQSKGKSQQGHLQRQTLNILHSFWWRGFHSLICLTFLILDTTVYTSISLTFIGWFQKRAASPSLVGKLLSGGQVCKGLYHIYFHNPTTAVEPCFEGLLLCLSEVDEILLCLTNQILCK